MPVIVIKDGFQTEYSCAAWEMMPPNKNGYTLISQDCGNESQNNGAHQVPYAYGYSEFAPSSTGDKHYTHHQGTAASIWDITHNLGKHPTVAVVDSAGSEVVGQVISTNDNQIQIIFSSPFTGKAYLN